MVTRPSSILRLYSPRLMMWVPVCRAKVMEAVVSAFSPTRSINTPTSLPLPSPPPLYVCRLLSAICCLLSVVCFLMSSVCVFDSVHRDWDYEPTKICNKLYPLLPPSLSSRPFIPLQPTYLHPISHSKSWHVWNQDNLDKVKRDEEEHAAEEVRSSALPCLSFP
jgi:hypothetical protein